MTPFQRRRNIPIAQILFMWYTSYCSQSHNNSYMQPINQTLSNSTVLWKHWAHETWQATLQSQSFRRWMHACVLPGLADDFIESSVSFTVRSLITDYEVWVLPTSITIQYNRPIKPSGLNLLERTWSFLTKSLNCIWNKCSLTKLVQMQ